MNEKKKEATTKDVERQILDRVLELREETKSNKFVGALTIEFVRKYLIENGFNVSNRDVFIKSVGNELDLLVLKKDTNAIESNVLYEPENVIAVLEIKFRGSYGKDELDSIREKFNKIRKLNPKIKCLYSSVSENKNYKYRITADKLGYPVFELFTRPSNLESSLKKGLLKVTGDWKRLINTI